MTTEEHLENIFKLLVANYEEVSVPLVKAYAKFYGLKDFDIDNKTLARDMVRINKILAADDPHD